VIRTGTAHEYEARKRSARNVVRPAPTLEDLTYVAGFWYLATPYSKWANGIDDAAFVAAEVAAKIIRRGVPVYSPIAHTHPIAVVGNIDPLDHAIWMPMDKPIFDAAVGLIVAMLEGWRESYGIGKEIAWCEAAGKPIFMLDPKTMELSPHVAS
jgi:hypothetical protein